MTFEELESIREEINQCLYHGDMITLAEIVRKLLDSLYETTK